jgi:DNA polymerase-3 subunit delta'
MAKLSIQTSRFYWPMIGHKNIINYLQQNLTDELVSQAYLFVGPDHVGKATVAHYFVNSLLCSNLGKESGKIPCGECDYCRQLANGIHPDVFWLKRELNSETGKLKKNISIEQIRELCNKLSLHSFLNSYKVAVIEQAEALSLEAANSLLKTLEEPSAKTVIILLVNNLAAVPKTVASRCQILKFLPVSGREIFDHLVFLDVDRKKAKSLASLAFGRPGIARHYLDSQDEFMDFQEAGKNFISLFKADNISRFKLVSEIVSQAETDAIKANLLIWQKILRDLILIKVSLENLTTNDRLSSELTALAGRYPLARLIKLISEINQSQRYLGANVNPRLVLENLVLSF